MLVSIRSTLRASSSSGQDGGIGIDRAASSWLDVAMGIHLQVFSRPIYSRDALQKAMFIHSRGDLFAVLFKPPEAVPDDGLIVCFEMFHLHCPRLLDHTTIA